MNLSLQAINADDFAVLANKLKAELGQEKGNHIHGSIIPHENDILLGRGGKNNQHFGNIQLRNMTRQFCSAYYGATKKEKPAVARGLVQCIQNLNPPGRFLKHSLGGWEEATASVAQEKASQSLRDTVASVLKEANIQDGTHPKNEVFTQKCLDELHPGSSRHPKSATKDSVLFQDSTEQLPNGIARSYQESESSCQVRMPDSLAVNFGDQMLLSMDATSSISLQEEFNENGKRSGISFLEADLNSKIQRFSTDRAFCTMGLIDNSDFCSMANSKPQYQISSQVTTSRVPCTTSTKLSFDTWTGNGGFSLNDAARYAHLAQKSNSLALSAAFYSLRLAIILFAPYIFFLGID